MAAEKLHPKPCNEFVLVRSFLNLITRLSRVRRKSVIPLDLVE